MTDHGRLHRSPHGQFVRSPHGQFNGKATGDRPWTDQLLAVAFIDESGGMYYGAGQAGVDRYRTDKATFEALADEGRAVIGLVVDVTGGDYDYALIPDGEPWPGEYIVGTSAARPVEEVTPAMRGAIGLAMGKFYIKHGATANLRGSAYSIDTSESMGTPAYSVPGMPHKMTEYLSAAPPLGINVMSPDASRPTIVYPDDERWLLGMIDAVRAFYRDS